MVTHDDKFRVLRKLPEVRFEEELRGYSKSQVDRVLQSLAPLADDVGELQARLAEAERRAAAAEARLAERPAPVESPATTPAPVAAAPVVRSTADFDETLSKTLLLAQRTADMTVAEAKAEAEALLAASRSEADGLRAETAKARSAAGAEVAEERRNLLEAAHREVQEKVEAAEESLSRSEGAMREQLVAEIAELSALRDGLSADIAELEGHLAQRRDAIRAAVADMTTIIDDPKRLRSEMPPVADGPIELPKPSPGGPVLDVEGLDELVPDEPPTTPSVEPRRDVVDHDDGSGPPTEAIPVVTASPAQAPDDRFDRDSVAAGDDDDEPWDADPGEGAIEVRWEGDVDTMSAPAEFGFDDAGGTAPSGSADAGRPAWADAVPDAAELPASVTSDDPFLDELRRATSDEAEPDAALERFLADEPDDDRRGGWFSRR